MAPRQASSRGDRLEARLRRAWTRRPGPGLRAASFAFGLGVDARRLLQELGLVRARRVAVPVVSVGGLTAGGSGQTPIASLLARWLSEAGRRPAIVTPGLPDELAAHRHLLPDVPVLGARRRWRAVAEAVRMGARSVVLDAAASHRALARDLDLLLVDADAVTRTNRRRLPAGPFRHGLAATALADAIVVTRRATDERSARRLAERLARDGSGRPVGLCALRSGAATPANRAAEMAGAPRPAIALAGIMKPRIFLAAARDRWPDLEHARSFRDHRGPGRGELEALVRRAGGRGIVCTLKDAVRLAPRVANRVPIWYLDDLIEWEREGSEIRKLVLRRTAASGRTRLGCAQTSWSPAAGSPG